MVVVVLGQCKFVRKLGDVKRCGGHFCVNLCINMKRVRFVCIVCATTYLVEVVELRIVGFQSLVLVLSGIVVELVVERIQYGILVELVKMWKVVWDKCIKAVQK